MTATRAAALRWRVHHATCELDAHGQIDQHAALCLELAIAAARHSAIEMVLVDLRDLTAITPAGLALFRAHSADCHAHGKDLGVLIRADERHAQIAEAFVLAGLGDQLHYTHQPPVPAAAQTLSLLSRAPSVRWGRLTRVTKSPHRSRSARPA